MMLSEKSKFNEMVIIRKGMVEAILLPFFDMIDLVRFAGLC